MMLILAILGILFLVSAFSGSRIGYYPASGLGTLLLILLVLWLIGVLPR